MGFDNDNRHTMVLQEWRVSIPNIYRENNQVAYILAKKSMELNIWEKRTWNDPPKTR